MPEICHHSSDTHTGSHSCRYVNPFVRELRPRLWLRFSSTVGGPRPVTRIVGKAAPVASGFDCFSLSFSGGFRQSLGDCYIPARGTLRLSILRERQAVSSVALSCIPGESLARVTGLGDHDGVVAVGILL